MDYNIISSEKYTIASLFHAIIVVYLWLQYDG